jgi:hypothetical protein
LVPDFGNCTGEFGHPLKNCNSKKTPIIRAGGNIGAIILQGNLHFVSQEVTKMKQRATSLIALASLLIGLSSAAVYGVEAMITLIDGPDGIDNFNQVGEGNWSAVEGVVQATASTGGAAFLVTKEAYSDFNLRIEFWASDDANSGIFLRCQEPDNINDRNCYEANIFDQRPDPSFGTGGIVHIAPVSEPLPKARGKWNIYNITLQGSHLVVVLNGVTTVDVQDSLFASGPIALQWGRGTIRFRNVQIRPF